MSLTDCSLLNFKKNGDRRGYLTPAESFLDVPFAIKRVFYLYDIPSGSSRGAHAHHECHQVLIAASGSFQVQIKDGKNTEVIQLNKPNIGLHIPPLIWASEINFSSGAICLVLASHLFQEADYIRDYDQYLELVNE